MKFSKLELPLRATLLYLLFGGLWILLSDQILSLLIFHNPQQAPQQAVYQTLKGWFFILVSAILLYILLRKDFKGLQHAEQAAQLENARWQEIVSVIADEVWICDAQGKMSLLNLEAVTAEGLDMFQNRSVYEVYQDVEIFHPNGQPRPPEQAPLLRALRGEIAHGEEIMRHRQTGISHYRQFSSAPTRAANGEIIGAVAIVRDITEKKTAEEGLRRYELLSEHSRDIILYMRSDDGHILDANAAARQAYGYSRDELLALTVRDLRAPHTIGLTAEQMAQANAEGILFETLHMRKDGSTFPVEISSRGATIGGVRTLISIIRDITERKRAEEEVQRSETTLRAILEQLPSGVTVRDAQSGALILSNARSQEIMGALVDSADQFAQYRGFRPDGRLYQSRDWPLSRSMANGEVVHAEEIGYQRNDGAQITLSINSAPVRDPQGQIRMGVAVFDDVTGRKRAEEYIRYQARLLENVSDAIIASDMQGTITSWNAAAEEIYGWRADEVIGGFVNDVLRTEYTDGVTEDEVLQHFLEEGQWKGESIQRRKDEERITVLASVSIIRNPTGTPIAMLAVNRDISARKRAEEELRTLLIELEQRVLERTAQLNQTNMELERASRTKDEFLANMSHELRTPLNSILGMSEILLEQRRGALNEYQHRSLQLVESSGHHLLDLINDILDLSKIEAGKLDYYPQPVSVDELCRSSLAFVKTQAAKKSIPITYTNLSGVIQIFADPRRLKQALVNLLSNAVKFTPEKGEVTLKVDTDLEQDLIQFSVIDTGIGIAQEDLQKLFQPFVQLDSRLNRQYDGTGLGLSLVQKLIDLHGGSVHAQSDGVPGKGSRFTINLSCRQDHVSSERNLKLDQAPVVSPEKTSTFAEVPALHGVILLAEDQLSNVLTIGEYLKNFGYEVIVAHDGLEAIAKAEEAKPDLILMDIQMPAMNGLEAMARLRADPLFASTPIIALTALAMPGDRERCMRAGASEYLSKPVSLKALRQMIEHFLEK